MIVAFQTGLPSWIVVNKKYDVEALRKSMDRLCIRVRVEHGNNLLSVVDLVDNKIIEISPDRWKTILKETGICLPNGCSNIQNLPSPWERTGDGTKTTNYITDTKVI